ncbi:probable septum site-determining protein MinC 2 [Firmicutes bacterium CAG:534]|nr:probable septum site-determining protein MinC 2 [Firmicutes bacterium CAG:534]
MKNSVVIKSFPSGIVLHLDPDLPFDQLLADVGEKFRESSSFFKDAKMALSLKGRVLSDFEEQQILDAITQNSELRILCLTGEDDETNQTFVKALRQADFTGESADGNGQFYRGTLRNGQVLETESSIVVLGDVYPGSAIISARDIIVLGGLFGEAYAGGNGSSAHYVVALEMSPEKLKIGDFKYHSKDKASKWSIRPKVQPKIAYVKDKRVVLDSLTKELLSGFSV